MFENRRWLIIPTNRVNEIIFNEVIENNIESLRFSIDGTKTFVKYDVENNEDEILGRPSFFNIGLNEYGYSNILEIMESEEWKENIKQN
jgi:hypothetical protein